MTPSVFLARFPQFQALETAVPGTIQGYLDRAGPYFDVCRWGAFYTDGLENWAAHMIVMDQAEQTQFATAPSNPLAGDVTTKTIGRETISRDGTLLGREMTDSMLKTTYGQRYVKLRRLVGLGGAAV
jgi:hypothetical protein